MIPITIALQPIYHIRIESLTKVIIIMYVLPTRTDMAALYKKYYKYMVIAVNLSNTLASLNELQKWISAEYSNLFDINLPDGLYNLDSSDYKQFRYRIF
jgi:hypothetical protein